MVLQGHRWPLVQYTGNTPETNLCVCVLCVFTWLVVNCLNTHVGLVLDLGYFPVGEHDQVST